ncbi:DinB family protein [Mucilaginibacter sp. KACC 22063]|uniref:DinB family protein n=1 Tax=Mucilaginibacter sp. KACC 22063 TaxID=3025666 RepID=UPI0030826702
MMSLIEIFKKELEAEAVVTRKMLERVPTELFDWQPHEKSMTMRRLATHIADLPNWTTMGLTTDGLDFQSNNWKEEVVNNTAELLDYFERSLNSARKSLNEASEDVLDQEWVLRNGDQILYTSTKAETVRMSFNQTVHHRAQLGVYLRLNNIPIPATYGPSADEH